MSGSSLAARLALAMAALVIVAVVATTVAAIAITDRQVTAETERFLVERSDQIINGERERPGRGQGRRAIGARAAVVAAEDDAVVQAIGPNGDIVGSTGLDLPVSDGDVRLAERGGRSQLRTVEVDGVSHRMITAAIPGGGAIQVARSLEESSALRRTIRSRLLVLGIPLALLAAGVGWWIARRSLGPLSSLAASAERIADTGDLSTPVQGVGRDDEVGRLASSFDEMLGALSASREQQHQLIQDAAHELRTPLTSVTANVDLLARAPDLDGAERAEILGGAQRELRQLRTLFTEIIELATDDRAAAPHGPVDLLELARQVAGAEQQRSSTPITVTGVASVVQGDRGGLERAIGNIVANAVKYAPPSTPIVIDVSPGSVRVTDGGPGIDPADRRRVFDRFYRSESARSQPGSGLGLAIVDKIVTAHGGTTFVEDARPGPGAVVGFTLPVEDA